MRVLTGLRALRVVSQGSRVQGKMQVIKRKMALRPRARHNDDALRVAQTSFSQVAEPIPQVAPNLTASAAVDEHYVLLAGCLKGRLHHKAAPQTRTHTHTNLM